MNLEEARAAIQRLVQGPSTHLNSAMEGAVSETELRRLSHIYDEAEARRAERNEALQHADRCIEIVDAMVRMLWYRGETPAPDKIVVPIEFLLFVQRLLDDYKPWEGDHGG
jgi:hypothetical protein